MAAITQKQITKIRRKLLNPAQAETLKIPKILLTQLLDTLEVAYLKNMGLQRFIDLSLDAEHLKTLQTENSAMKTRIVQLENQITMGICNEM